MVNKRERQTEGGSSSQALPPAGGFCPSPQRPRIPPTLAPTPADLEDPLGEARLLRELLQVLGVGVVVNGKVRLHGPKLVVLEGGAHALRLLAARVRLVAVQMLRVVLVAAQRCGGSTEAAGEPPDLPPTHTLPSAHPPPNVSSLGTTLRVPHHAEIRDIIPILKIYRVI